MTFGQRLRRARIKVGLKQEHVAQDLKVHKVTVSKWERDVQRPGATHLDRMADLYRTTTKTLLQRPVLTENVSRGTSDTESGREGSAATEVRRQNPPPGAVPLGYPRHMRNLPQAVREYLDESRLRLTKGGATEDEVDEAVALLRSPDIFGYFSGGKLNEYTEADVLDGMRSIVENSIIPRLRKLGRKIP